MNKIPSEGSPTMIIPAGTQIEVDVHGQLSIRTPGNLVIQNSGSYGTIESSQGSIRIEPNVQVEAVNIECAETCYVQGSLTAWKVNAKAIQLEDTARAHIILQETERLEVGREARLVGNFSSEKELFLLFSRFAKQLKSMPFYFDRRDGLTEDPPAALTEAQTPPEGSAPEGENGPDETGNGAAAVASASAEEGGVQEGELPQPLFFSLLLLEREAARPGNGPTSQRVVAELVKLLRARDTEALRHTYRSLFERISDPSADVERARKEIEKQFGNGAPD